MVKSVNVSKGIASFLKDKYRNKGGIVSGREEFLRFNEPQHWISTGIRPLDLAIGGRGIPSGKIILVSADATLGKTLLGLHLCVRFQQHIVPGFVHYIAPESGAAADWMESLGVDLSEDALVQPKGLTCLEELFEYIELCGRWHMKHEPKRPIFFFIDSITAFLPKSTMEKDYKTAFKQKGNEAAIISGGLKKLEMALNHSNNTLLFISQLRSRISMNPMQPIIGDPQAVTGGAALGYYNSLHLRLRQVYGRDIYSYEDAKKRDRVHEQEGTEVEIFVYKSRICFPHRKAFVPIYWQETKHHPIGFDPEQADLNWLIDRELISTYAGKDKALVKAGSNEIELASGSHVFTGLSGWRNLLTKEKLNKEIGDLMLANASSRCAKDERMEEASSKSQEDTAAQDRELDQMDRDLENLADEAPDFDVQEEEEAPPPPKKGKGKGKSRPPPAVARDEEE